MEGGGGEVVAELAALEEPVLDEAEEDELLSLLLELSFFAAAL